MQKARYHTEKIILPSPAAGTHILWRAPVACTVKGVWAYRVGGTGAAVNVTKNGTNVLTADLSLTSAGAWMGGAATLKTDSTVKLAAGDTLAAVVVSAAGSPTEATIQVDMTLNADVR